MQSKRSSMETVEPRVLMSRAYGIDVSHYQDSINWTSVKAQTTPNAISFAMIKATGSDGGNYQDSYFTSNAANAKAAGVLYGVYHFAEPVIPAAGTDTTTANAAILSDANSEADYFLSKASTRMGKGYLPPMLDLEASGSTKTVAFLSTWANDFCNRVYNAVGVKPTIYCSSSYATTYVDTSVSQWPLWVAAYPANGTNIQTYNPAVGNSTHGWTSWTFWQYSDDQYTPVYANGVGGSGVDGDVYKSDAATLLATYASVAKLAVTQGSTTITSGQSTAINFGNSQQGATGTSESFTIANTGTATMTTSGLTVPAGYTVTNALASSIAVGASDTVTLQQNTSTLGTFAGNVGFTTNDPTSATFSFPITGSVSTTPVIIASKFDYTASTPSISFTFNEDVSGSLALSDFSVYDNTTGTESDPIGYSWNSSTNTATASWAHDLADGNYTATLTGSSIADSVGDTLAADYTMNFFSLAGDVNHDRSVDISDLTILAGSFGKSGKTFSDGDITHDGKVDISDLTLLSNDFGNTLAPPSASSNATAFALPSTTKSKVKTGAAPSAIDLIGGRSNSKVL